MANGTALLCLLLPLGAVGWGCGADAGLPDVSLEAARREAAAFRAKHEEDYRRDWSTIAGLHFLNPGPNTAGSAPSNDIVLTSSAPPVVGRFVLEGSEVRFEPAGTAGVPVLLREQRVIASRVLADDAVPQPDMLTVGSIRMVVHVSGDRRSLRVWDPEGELAKRFLGFRWFDIQPEYRVIGRFIADAEPRTVRVLNTFGDVDPFRTEGVVQFPLQGRVLHLRAFTTRPNRLYFVFKDASSGQETYGAARFLYSDLRSDGSTVLDFNQAYNPPCAFNPYTTCPIPLSENALPVKVLAGERSYPVHP